MYVLFKRGFETALTLVYVVDHVEWVLVMHWQDHSFRGLTESVSDDDWGQGLLITQGTVSCQDASASCGCRPRGLISRDWSQPSSALGTDLLELVLKSRPQASWGLRSGDWWLMIGDWGVVPNHTFRGSADGRHATRMQVVNVAYKNASDGLMRRWTFDCDHDAEDRKL